MEHSRISNAHETADLNEVMRNENYEIAKTLRHIFGFFARGFNNRPDTEFVRVLRESKQVLLHDMAEGVELSNEGSLGMREMAEYLEASVGKSDSDLEQELAVDWTRLFRGINPQISPKPPYEGVYIISNKSSGEILQSVIQFYHESGFTIGDEYRDRLDYIGMEFSFLSHLADVEAQAWDLNDIDLALSYQTRAQEFINKHLGLWANKFLSIAIDRAKTGFYRGFLRFCHGIVSKLMVTIPIEQGGVSDKY